MFGAGFTLYAFPFNTKEAKILSQRWEMGEWGRTPMTLSSPRDNARKQSGLSHYVVQQKINEIVRYHTQVNCEAYQETW